MIPGCSLPRPLVGEGANIRRTNPLALPTFNKAAKWAVKSSPFRPGGGGKGLGDRGGGITELTQLAQLNKGQRGHHRIIEGVMRLALGQIQVTHHGVKTQIDVVIVEMADAIKLLVLVVVVKR